MFHLWTAPAPLQLHRRLALIVDGDQAFRRFALRLLSRFALAPVAVESGESALEWLAGSPPPALLVVDACLPHMSGFALCEVLRGSERTAHTPMLMVSSRGTDIHDHTRALQVGADAFLEKSASVGEHIVAVQRLLDVAVEAPRLRA